MPDLVLLVDDWKEPLEEGGFRKRVKGELFSAVQETADWLVRSGGAKLVDGTETVTVTDETSADTQADSVTDDTTTEEAESDDSDSSTSGLPKKAAKIEDWQQAAEERGIDSRGMTKPQLIKAVEDYEAKNNS
jgi:hypothetical protein|nr:MAG TPA: LEM-like domain protein [Caudoviricetes sp.]